LREIEEEHIQLVLAHCGGNKSRAARILGLSRQGLLDRIKRAGPVAPAYQHAADHTEA
jgi:DNA-binding protein Fis